MEEEEEGWVYVLFNELYPSDLYKIGYTTRPLEERVNELSRPTGVPGPFKIRTAKKMINPKEREKNIHKFFKEQRKNKEFFSLSSKDLENLDILFEMNDGEYYNHSPEIPLPNTKTNKIVDSGRNIGLDASIANKSNSFVNGPPTAIVKSTTDSDSVRYSMSEVFHDGEHIYVIRGDNPRWVGVFDKTNSKITCSNNNKEYNSLSTFALEGKHDEGYSPNSKVNGWRYCWVYRETWISTDHLKPC